MKLKKQLIVNPKKLKAVLISKKEAPYQEA